MSEADDIAMARRHVDALAEHFDTVQIFVTRVAEGGDSTTHVQVGSGNYFARYGQIKMWCTKEEEGAREDFRNEPET